MKQCDLDVSIVIPAFGREEKISSLMHNIKTVANGLSFEVLVVDGSLSEAIEGHVLAAGPEFQYMANSDDKGPGHARQVGIAAARGRYIAFLDTDDLYLNDKLKVQLNFMSKYQLDFTYTRYEQYWPTSGRSYVRSPLPSFQFKKALVTRGIALSTVMIRNNQAWHAVTERIVPRGEDYFWWLQYLKEDRSRRAVLCPIVGSRIVISPDSISNDRIFHHSVIFKYYLDLISCKALAITAFFCYLIYAFTFKVKSKIFAKPSTVH